MYYFPFMDALAHWVHTLYLICTCTQLSINTLWGGVTQWVARLTRNVEVVGSSPIIGPPLFP